MENALKSFWKWPRVRFINDSWTWESKYWSTSLKSLKTVKFGWCCNSCSNHWRLFLNSAPVRCRHLFTSSSFITQKLFDHWTKIIVFQKTTKSDSWIIFPFISQIFGSSLVFMTFEEITSSLEWLANPFSISYGLWIVNLHNINIYILSINTLNKKSSIIHRELFFMDFYELYRLSTKIFLFRPYKTSELPALGSFRRLAGNFPW